MHLRLPLVPPLLMMAQLTLSVAVLVDVGSYTEAERKAIDDFLEVFKHHNFVPSSSVMFTDSSMGSLHIGFSRDSSVPEESDVVIDNKHVSESVLDRLLAKTVFPLRRNRVWQRDYAICSGNMNI
ncbi:hypothetical protein LIER_11941 [Lithospermum erythrorhizon]|uniref:Chalcone-flavonone isomerase family protein n=1 Tax=Lithospermum erythrorhizon TaxID=34254 RepID=A0AAV3PS87_LITER